MLQAVVINGMIYVIGGTTSGGSCLSSVEALAISSQPDAPSLTATAGDALVSLNWSSVSDATSYNIYRSTTAGGPYMQSATGITGTTYTDTGLTNDTTYYYVVTAVNATGESVYSNEASATPTEPETPPSSYNATLRITMITGEIKEYDVTSTIAESFISWFTSGAASSPVFVFEKTSGLGPYTSRTEYIAYDKISSFEVLKY
jgi:hypothetical protein